MRWRDNRAEAEQSLEAGHYSLVVLDLGLPMKMDCIFSPVSGRKNIPCRTDPHRSRYADRQNRRAGCRCDDYLVKPFALEELHARIRARYDAIIIRVKVS